MTYTIHEADIEKDKGEIISFWKKNRGSHLDDKYRWIYEGNPCGKASVWILTDDTTGTQVGMTSLFPRWFTAKGKRYCAGIAGDFIVMEGHRTLGPALMLQKSVLSAVDSGRVDFVYSFPNKAAEPVMKRVGYNLLGPTVRLVRIFKSAPTLRRRGISELWVGLLSPLLDIALKLRAFETWYCGKRGYVCEEVLTFDERFDKLWEESKEQFSIAGERSSLFLRWKYLEDFDEIHRIVAVFNLDKTILKGYIVFCFRDNCIHIRDFIFSCDGKATKVLMAWLLRYARSSAIESISIGFLKNDYLIRFMKDFGFMRGEDGRNAFFYCSKSTLGKLPLMKDSNDWLLMDSDEDT
ncbi:MAG: hypothetical protein ACE5EE_11545 [Fidelibacterota bacterium]